ncbi:galactose-3-O-sulfotransferase 3 isoform X2 [Microcaecilia unicolor]|uniref:Galactose-3-O-sulfotransferase 3 isoform X2 n=1 Tax=Microcaecilia unicolor TaxID=1415580 RepID=A0A6P7ZHC8_9AMPH|nr:galactose-3-O-sulfotransferase 3 isoform X2 [Microcaecilia unicolor]
MASTSADIECRIAPYLDSSADYLTQDLSRLPKSLPFSCASPGASQEKLTAVAFLKTHKTASSTVQNIFFRFAERHNLTVALPHNTCEHQFCYPQNFSIRFVHPYTIHPSIVASHMRLNTSELKRLMPNDTAYVTILREPAAMFESLFSYYNQYCLSFKTVPNASMDAFLSNPLKYYQPQEKYSMYAHNTLIYDLGGDIDHATEDEGYILDFIKKMESLFSLVMIAEYFDESLVLMRRLFSWDLEDIVYVKLNMRSLESKVNVTSVLSDKIRAWNALDAQLYDHFNATFWEKIRQLGIGCVQKEVDQLRQAREQLARQCFGGSPQPRLAAQIRNKDLRPWQPSNKVSIVGYDLPAVAGSELCLKLVMPEKQYTKYLLKKQGIKVRQKMGHRTLLPAKSLTRGQSQHHKGVQSPYPARGSTINQWVSIMN